MTYPTSVGSLPNYSLNGDVASLVGTFPNLDRIVETDIVGPTAANKQPKSLEVQNATMHDRINDLVAFVDADAAAKVSKSGDTMTGVLTLAYAGLILKAQSPASLRGGNMVFQKPGNTTNMTADLQAYAYGNTFALFSNFGANIGNFIFDLYTGNVSNTRGSDGSTGITFSQIPACSVAPTSGNHLVNKTYIDSITSAVRPRFFKASLTGGHSISTTGSQDYVFNFSSDFNLEFNDDNLLTLNTTYVTLPAGYVFELEIFVMGRTVTDDASDTGSVGGLAIYDVTGSPTLLSSSASQAGVWTNGNVGADFLAPSTLLLKYKLDTTTGGAKNIKISYIRLDGSGKPLTLGGGFVFIKTYK